VKEEERKNYLQGRIGSAAAVMEDCKEPDLNVTFTSPSAYVLCCNAHAQFQTCMMLRRGP